MTEVATAFDLCYTGEDSHCVALVTHERGEDCQQNEF